MEASLLEIESRKHHVEAVDQTGLDEHERVENRFRFQENQTLSFTSIYQTRTKTEQKAV